MTKGDRLVEKGADRLQELSQKAAAEGGVKGKLADELADDAAFLRKLKPSLMVARAKGEAPKDQSPGSPQRAPAGPQLGKRSKPKRNGGGPSPFLVVGVSLIAGIAIAKWIDWRGHAHPRR
jgi:hypothetical protein